MVTESEELEVRVEFLGSGRRRPKEALDFEMSEFVEL
jgi:hypothetical protein